MPVSQLNGLSVGSKDVARACNTESGCNVNILLRFSTLGDKRINIMIQNSAPSSDYNEALRENRPLK